MSSGGGWLVPEAEVYARHAISTLGVAHHTTGYWPHTLQVGSGERREHNQNHPFYVYSIAAYQRSISLLFIQLHFFFFSSVES